VATNGLQDFAVLVHFFLKIQSKNGKNKNKNKHKQEMYARVESSDEDDSSEVELVNVGNFDSDGDVEEKDNRVELKDYWRLVSSNRWFRALWVSSFISSMGDWLAMVAVISLVEDLWAQSIAVSILLVAQSLAPLFASPLAGVLVDRYDKRVLMVATDLARVLVVLCYGFSALGADSSSSAVRVVALCSIYALVALEQAFACVFEPARQALMPDYVHEDDLIVANSMANLTWAVSTALSTGVGGVVAAQFGRQVNFAVDAATFALSAFFVAQLFEPVYRLMPWISCHLKPSSRRHFDGDSSCALDSNNNNDDDDDVETPTVDDDKEEEEEDGEEDDGKLNVLRSYRIGLRYMRDENRDCLWLALFKGLMNVSLAVVEVLSARLAILDFQIDDDEGQTMLGVSHAGGAVFALFATLLVNHTMSPSARSMRVWAHAGFALGTLGLALFAWPRNGYVYTLAYSIFDGGNTVLYVMVTTLMQMEVKKSVRGRVFATGYALRTTLYAAGALSSGALIDALADSGATEPSTALAVTAMVFLVFHVAVHLVYHFFYLMPWIRVANQATLVYID
jgi:Major Facilitator Superfamily